MTMTAILRSRMTAKVSRPVLKTSSRREVGYLVQLYAGLLDQGHREGLKRISTTLLQAPSDDNGHLAICSAEVETEKGVFSGIGDASPENVGRMIAMHTVRMAETRANARALRDAVNGGVTALEEL